MDGFGTLSRRMPQDRVPTLPSAYPFFRRAEIDDRRDRPMTALEEAKLLLNLIDNPPPRYQAAGMPVPAVTPLAIDAGMLDVHPSHERWLAERIGALPSSITASAK